MLVKGENVVLLIKVSGVYTPYVCAKDASINITTETIETSVSGSGLWATFLPTKNSFTISIGGGISLNETGSLTLADLQALQFAQTVVEVSFDETDLAGNVYRKQCNAYITNSSDSGSFDGMGIFSIEMIGTGAITRVLHYDGILQETGDYILQETGDYILTE